MVATGPVKRQEIIDAIGQRKDKIQTALRNLISRNIITEVNDVIYLTPDPLLWGKTTTKAGRKFTKEAWKLAMYLAESIEFWKPDFIESKASLVPRWQTSWAFDIDKLLKGHTTNEIKHVIDQMSRDKDQEHKGPRGFSWRRNILSGKKLVEKWPKLSVRYGPKSNKVKREKRNYDTPEPKDYNPEEWDWKGPDIDKVF